MTAEGREGTPPITLKPKEAARMAAIGEDAEFGKLLAYKVQLRWPVLLLLIIPLPFMLFAVSAVASYLFWPPKHTIVPTAGAQSPWIPAAIATGVSLVISIPVVWWFRRLKVEHRFFQHGYERWGFRRGSIHRLSYLDVESMTYTRQIQRAEVFIVWVAASLVLKPAKNSGAKGLKLSFNHRGKVRGLLEQRIEGLDPMDLVRDAVAEAVSERLAVEIAEKGSAPWTGPVRFTKEGLEVKGLIGGAKVLPFETIDRMSSRAGAVTFHQAGEKGGAVTLWMNSKNFWPGFTLLQTLVTPRRAGGTADGVGIDPDEFEDED